MFRRQHIRLICERLTTETAEPFQLKSVGSSEDHPIRVIEIRNIDGVPLFPFYKPSGESA